MNVTPRNRARLEPTRWRLECGICRHSFETELAYTNRMSATCPSCGSGNVWNEPGAPPADAAPAPDEAPAPAG
jgi:rRNA maturation endonuclease Nob1